MYRSSTIILTRAGDRPSGSQFTWLRFSISKLRCVLNPYICLVSIYAIAQFLLPTHSTRSSLRIYRIFPKLTAGNLSCLPSNTSSKHDNVRFAVLIRRPAVIGTTPLLFNFTSGIDFSRFCRNKSPYPFFTTP